MYGLYGRIVASCYGGVGTVVRIGFRTFATKQDGRAAKHIAINNQIGEPFAPTYFRYFVAKIDRMGF